MNYRTLGHTGLQVSEFSLGSWDTYGSSVSFDVTRDILAFAYSEGVNHFDTAEIYANGDAEIALGLALKALGWNRQTYLITTKLMWGTGLNRPNTSGLSRKHVIEGCRASLSRLGLDYVDFLVCHRVDRETPLEETIAAIGHLLASGDILYWGVSEWPTEMITEAITIADANGIRRPVLDQSQYNLFERRRVEHDLHSLASQGVGVLSWSPLFYGMLARCALENSRIVRADMAWLRQIALPEFERDAKLAILKVFKTIAREAGLSPAGTALCWCLGFEGVTSVISGASRLEQLRNNLKEIGLVKDRAAIRREVEMRLNAYGWRYDLSANAFKPIAS